MMKDDAEFAGIVVEVVEDTGELNAGGVLRRRWSRPRRRRAGLQRGLDRRRAGCRADGQNGVARELRIAEQLIRSEAATDVSGMFVPPVMPVGVTDRPPVRL